MTLTEVVARGATGLADVAEPGRETPHEEAEPGPATQPSREGSGSVARAAASSAAGVARGHEDLFDPDRYFEVTVRYWKRTTTVEVQSTLTTEEAQVANDASVAATGWPAYVRPADLAALATTAKPARSRLSALLRRRGVDAP